MHNVYLFHYTYHCWHNIGERNLIGCWDAQHFDVMSAILLSTNMINLYALSPAWKSISYHATELFYNCDNCKHSYNYANCYKKTNQIGFLLTSKWLLPFISIISFFSHKSEWQYIDRMEKKSFHDAFEPICITFSFVTAIWFSRGRRIAERKQNRETICSN